MKRNHFAGAGNIVAACLIIALLGGCTILQRIGQPMTPRQQWVQANESYTATVTWLTQAANAGLIDESDKPKIRAIRLQIDAALNAAEVVLNEGGDANTTLKAIDRLIDELIAQKLKAEKKARS